MSAGFLLLTFSFVHVKCDHDERLLVGDPPNVEMSVSDGGRSGCYVVMLILPAYRVHDIQLRFDVRCLSLLVPSFTHTMSEDEAARFLSEAVMAVGPIRVYYQTSAGDTIFRDLHISRLDRDSLLWLGDLGPVVIRNDTGVVGDNTDAHVQTSGQMALTCTRVSIGIEDGDAPTNFCSVAMERLGIRDRFEVESLDAEPLE